MLKEPNDNKLRRGLTSVIRATQGNFDHLQGMVRTLGEAHNALVDDMDEVQVFIEGGGATGPAGPAGSGSGGSRAFAFFAGV